MEQAAGPPVHVQEETYDPNRGQTVKSATGMFRGVGGQAEVEALNRAIANYDGWITVDSSNVEAGAYDFVENIMFIRFLAKGNRPSYTYYYPAVQPQEWMDFLQAGSKGKWVWGVLRSDGRDIRLYGIMP
jgi:hypothetical protein